MRLRTKRRQNHLIACMELVNTKEYSAFEIFKQFLLIEPEDLHNLHPEGQTMNVTKRGECLTLKIITIFLKSFSTELRFSTLQEHMFKII